MELDINRIQYLSIAGSVLLLLFIVYLIRKKRIRVEYSLVWLFFGGFFLFFSVWRDGLELVAKTMGVSYSPAALFLIILSGVVLLLIQFSVIISRLSRENRTLAQEVALLRTEVERVTGSPTAPEPGPDPATSKGEDRDVS